MIRYSVEGGMNFYEELYKSLDEEQDKQCENICLITNEPLTDKYVTLICGHKFNYVPLFNSVKNYKSTPNNLEKTKLKINEIKCPYCRKIQKHVLPYHSELGINRTMGVNYYDPEILDIFPYIFKRCEFLVDNQNYDPTQPESNVNKIKHRCCIQATQIKENAYGDEKYYCYAHMKKMLRLYKKQQEQEEKQKAKEEKRKAKEEKQQAKKHKTPICENIILGTTTSTSNTDKCIQILKSGPNKGQPCGCKIKENNLCGKHMKPVSPPSKSNIMEEKENT